MNKIRAGVPGALVAPKMNVSLGYKNLFGAGALPPGMYYATAKSESTMNPALPTLVRSRTSRTLYVGLGFFFLVLGVVGAALPVIPTTGPLLVALWCFSKGSARLHHWLYFHPRFGPPLQRWKEERIIPKKVKATAYSSMGISFAAMSLAGSSWVILSFTAAFMLVGVIFIASCPSESYSRATFSK